MAKTTGNGTERQDSPADDDRVGRVLAAIIIGIVVLCVVAIILYMIATASLWPQPLITAIWTVFFFGLPVAIILMIVVTIRLAVVRRRANQPPSQ